MSAQLALFEAPEEAGKPSYDRRLRARREALLELGVHPLAGNSAAPGAGHLR